DTTTSTTTTTTIPPLTDSNTWLTADTSDVTLDTPIARADGPTDWRDEIIYFIMTDRFNDGDLSNDETKLRLDDNTPLHDKTKTNRYHGGDLKGIADKVDYLRKLGATSIWITPIVENIIEDDGSTGYHGYWAHDFSVVDRHLTSAVNQDSTTDRKDYYKTFVDTMHDNGILVIQDIVVNHIANLALYKIGTTENWDPAFNSAGYGDAAHLWIEDSSVGSDPWVVHGLRTKPSAPFDRADFYNNCGKIAIWSGAEQILGDMSSLDDLKTTSAEVRAALIEVYTNWIKWAGVDGFRVDTVKHVEETFWDEFCPAIRANTKTINANKKIMQFGEVYEPTHEAMKKFSDSQRLDSLLNFEFYSKCLSVFKNGGATNGLTSELANRKSKLRSVETTDGAGVDAISGAINFIDNHDVARFLSSTSVSVEKLRCAIMYMMTTLGIPCIYYNTENDTVGSSADSGRSDMPDFNVTNKKTFTLIKKLAKIRTDNVALRRGDMAVIKDSTEAGIFAFARFTGVADENVIVVLNNSGVVLENQEIDVTSYATSGNLLENILYKEFSVADEDVTVTNGKITVTVEANSMKIYKKKI
ncbi:MAG TPA: alpha-amylase family glycosyl hydrolase, partial [Spirochaetota bacterium]|nr:alpha-amylase family glycosyl hydrolase [Spirochaetota bacterium]